MTLADFLDALDAKAKAIIDNPRTVGMALLVGANKAESDYAKACDPQVVQALVAIARAAYGCSPAIPEKYRELGKAVNDLRRLVTERA